MFIHQPSSFVSLLLFVSLLALALPPSDLSSERTFSAFSQQVQARYASQDTQGLKALCAAAPAGDAEWLCRYRLYPLTQDESLLEAIPAEAEKGATARAMALQAGLWGYKAVGASVFTLPTIGRRAERLLTAAHDRDDTDPYVLLVEGQSLFYKPAIVGGDKKAALKRFQQLRRVVERTQDAGISRIEADVWVWYARHTTQADRAESERERLLAQNPPALFRAFLLSPP